MRLKLAPVEACSVCEVKGYGRQKNYLDEYRGSEYSMAYLPKVEITLVGRRSAHRGGLEERSSTWLEPAGWATERYSCCQRSARKFRPFEATGGRQAEASRVCSSITPVQANYVMLKHNHQ